MTVTPYPAQLCLALQHYTLDSHAWPSNTIPSTAMPDCNTIPWTAMHGPATLYPGQLCLALSKR